MTGVTFINVFQVPPGKDEEFLGLWRQTNDYAQTKPGYLGHALHRALDGALGGTSAARYVNVARWASAEQFAAANDDHFRELVGQPGWRQFSFAPGLYEVVDTAVAEPG